MSHNLFSCIAAFVLSLNVNALSSAIQSSPSKSDVEKLNQRVTELEKRLEVLEGLIHSMRQTAAGASTDTDEEQKSQSSSDSEESAASATSAVILKVTSFAPRVPDLAALQEAAEFDAKCAAAEKELARLAEQKRRLLDVFKELDNTRKHGRDMSDVEYKRLCQENKNQRDDIVKVSAEIQNGLNIDKRKAVNKRRDAKLVGQRIEGVDSSGKHFVVLTKQNCSKILSIGVQVALVNPKGLQSTGAVMEYLVDRVEISK